MTNEQNTENLQEELAGLRQRIRDLETVLEQCQQRAVKSNEGTEARLRAFVSTLPDQAIIVDAEGRYHEVWTWGKDPSSILPKDPIGKTVYDFFDNEFVDFVMQTIHKTLASQKIQVVEYKRNNIHREARVAPFYSADSQETRVLWIWRDITERKLAEAELRYKNQFQELLIRLAMDFMTFPIEEIDTRIKNLIQQIGEFIGADRSYINLFSEDLSTGRRVYEWLAPNVEARIHKLQNVPLSAFSWVLDHYEKGEAIYFRNFDELPKNSLVTQLWQESGGKSGIHVPLFHRKKLIGELGFQIVQDEKTWSQDTIALLKVAAQFYVNARERQATETALRESEAQYRSLLEQIPAVVYRTPYDAPEQDLYISPYIETLQGFSQEEWLNTPNLWIEQLHPDDRERVLSQKRANPTCVSEHRVLTKDEEVLWVHDEAVIIYNEAQQAQYIQGVVFDITKQKHLEHALEQALESYQAVFNSNVNLLLIHDGELVLLVNQAISDLLEYTCPEELIGLPVSTLIHPEDRDFVMRRSEARRQGKAEPPRYQMRGISKTGKVFWVDAHFQIIEFAGQSVILASAVDITEQKRFEEELKRYRNHLEELVKVRTVDLETEIAEHEQTQAILHQSLKQLAEANQELEAFSYTVSHDLRAPLRALNNYSQFLQEDCGTSLSPDCLIYLEGIAESAQQMERLVNDLLDYSRINRVAISSSDIDIAELLDEIANSLHISHEAALKIPQTLPIIHAKRVRIEQIFSNLLGNALKFRRANIPLEISIYFEDTPDSWVFSVGDNGIGIDPKHHERIFGIFQRLHTQEEYEGTGIGLAIVEKAVREHLGQVTIESVLGQGSKFSFSIAKHLS